MADRREREVQPLLAALRRGLLQPLDRALRQLVGRGEHRLRAVDELRVAVGELRLRVRRAAASSSSLCSRLSLSASSSSAAAARPSGSSASWRAVCAEFLAHAGVVVEQRAVLEDQVLAHDALQRRRLLEQLAARAPRLRRLLHRLRPCVCSRSSDKMSSASA